jgi:RNA polymerase sigma-70 factor (ECF subfamily)
MEASLSHLTDEDLILRAKAGDRRSFENLIMRYEKPLYGYLVRLLRDESAAEDAFQDTWLRVLKALDRFDPQLRVAPWVYRIATNLCRDQVRRRRHRAHPSLDQPARPGEEGVLGELVPSPDPGPDARVESELLGEQVRLAVEQLPDRQREAFVLRHYQGLSYEEIARAQKCSLPAVKSNIHHAVVTLRRRLERLGLSPVTQS